MPYITREDGERFVIPSYRDVLVAKQKSSLKKEILLLSQNYGEYITLQKKTAAQYEVAFSPDTGYLLGESVWQQFKRPQDLIYCEAIPNTMEAILVIVKSGSVYLDGSFPIESIPEELIIFLTQQNHFEIYVYGEVPISETEEDGKFSFDPSSVKSFTVLTDPIFPTLPLFKIYQLQLVDAVLREHGIGVFPTRQLMLAALAIFLIWLGWHFFHSPTTKITQIISTASPYDAYYAALTSPDPSTIIQEFVSSYNVLSTIPGWQPGTMKYTDAAISAKMIANGASGTEQLLEWAKQNNVAMTMKSDGVYLQMNLQLPTRQKTYKIYTINDVLSTLIDRLASVYPGNNISLGETLKNTAFSTAAVTINIRDMPVLQLLLIANIFKDMPMVLKTIAVEQKDGTFSGSITLDALGN